MLHSELTLLTLNVNPTKLAVKTYPTGGHVRVTVLGLGLRLVSGYHRRGTAVFQCIQIPTPINKLLVTAHGESVPCHVHNMPFPCSGHIASL